MRIYTDAVYTDTALNESIYRAMRVYTDTAHIP